MAGGQGLTVISKMLAGPLVEQGRLHILPIRNVRLTRTFNLIYHKNKYLSEPLRHFIQTIVSCDYLGS